MAKEENLNKDIDLKNYDDPTGISLREMNFGLWLSEHRHKFLKIVTGVLIVLCTFFFVYSSYNLIIYFISGDLNAQLISGDIPTSPRQLTDDLVVTPLQIFSSGDRYDLVEKINNPNGKFMADFKYCFTAAGSDLFCGKGFVLPNEEKYILALGQELSGSQSEVSFRVFDLFWRRIDAHQIPDWNSFALTHLNFLISSLNFSAGITNSLSEKINLNNLEFIVKNQTPYGYYEVPLNILLFSGQELVGVHRYLLQNCLAGEERTVKISWPGNLSTVDRTVVMPDLNIMDEGVYLKYQGGTTR